MRVYDSTPSPVLSPPLVLLCRFKLDSCAYLTEPYTIIGCRPESTPETEVEALPSKKGTRQNEQRAQIRVCLGLHPSLESLVGDKAATHLLIGTWTHLHEEDVERHSQSTLRCDALQIGGLGEALRHGLQQLCALFEDLRADM